MRDQESTSAEKKDSEPAKGRNGTGGTPARGRPLLSLQRKAGNRAVSQMLTVQRHELSDKIKEKSEGEPNWDALAEKFVKGTATGTSAGTSTDKTPKSPEEVKKANQAQLDALLKGRNDANFQQQMKKRRF